MVSGLLMELEDHNCWTIAEAAGRRGPRRLQHLLSRAVWDDQQALDIASVWAACHLDDGEGVLIVDKTADEERRELAGVPEEVMFTAKPQLAGALPDRAHALGIRAAFVAGDEVYGGRELRHGIRQRGMSYVMAVRANHALTTGAGRTVTAARAVRMIPAHAWHRMRTGSGTKGHPLLRLGDAGGGQRRYTRRARRRAQRAAGPAAPLHRHPVVLPVLDTRAGPATPARGRLRPGRPSAVNCRPSARNALIDRLQMAAEHAQVALITLPERVCEMPSEWTVTALEQRRPNARSLDVPVDFMVDTTTTPQPVPDLQRADVPLRLVHPPPLVTR
jgi:hypothetical protein